MRYAPRRGFCDTFLRVGTISESGGVWRSLVAHLLWEQDVGGSNPSTPTTEECRKSSTGVLACATPHGGAFATSS